MERSRIIFILCALYFAACHKQPKNIIRITTEAIPVDSTLDAIQDSDYIAYLAPTKDVVDKRTSTVIGYAAEDLWVGRPECPMLNWATDALWEEAKRLFPGKVDAAITNAGGIRDCWFAGEITTGMVFELMPFDNSLVVLTLKGADLIDLCDTMAVQIPHGIAGMRVVIKNKQVQSVTVGGKPVNPDALYTIATNSYLIEGADHLTAFARHVDCWDSGQKIRDLYEHAIRTKGTIHAAVDGRMHIEP
jgi:2',3'-cyclic-nucleotide 2'-phosphodiesterase (5'-nucleotidase family)